MDWVSAAANLIGAPSSHHQTEEAGPTGDDTKESDKEAATPRKAHPRMDSRRLVRMRGSTDQSETRTGGNNTRETG